MNKTSLRSIYCITFVLLFIGVIKFSQADRNEELLNIFARAYFDEEYYISNYPEIQNQPVDPFRHYTTQGWKEGRNPSKIFDTQFYANLYLTNKNKYQLNPLADYVRSKISLKTRFTNPNQLNVVEPLKNPKYYLTLVAIFQNEARFLKEWIEFYRLIGVEHFYLYNHLSTDNFQEMLEPYIESGIIELNHIVHLPKNLTEWNKIQTTAYNETIKKIKNIAEWLIIVDTDEYLFPVQQRNLATVLKKFDKYASVSVNWKMFGSSDVNRIPEDKLLIESLTKSDNVSDLHVKNIVKPRYVESISHPHYAKLKAGYAQVTENLEYFTGPFSPTQNLNILRINHYWSRDWEFFNSTKVNRIHMLHKNLSQEEKKAKIETLVTLNKNYSIEYSTSILKYLDELRYNIFKSKY